MKLANTPPAYCSSCFNQDPQALHVDMEAYWDGPVTEPKGDGHDAVAIDDLILCEACVREAASLLPEYAPAQAELEEIKRDYRALFDFAKQLQETNATMAEALSMRVHVKAPAKAGKPAVQKTP